MSLDQLLVRKLQDSEARYADLNTQLADPEIIADSKRYQKAAKASQPSGAAAGDASGGGTGEEGDVPKPETSGKKTEKKDDVVDADFEVVDEEKKK